MTSITELSLSTTWENMAGKSEHSGRLSSQASSQKAVCHPSPTIDVVMLL
jgi:hypothetical protein